MKEFDVTDMMVAYSEDCVEYSESVFKVRLDYSEQSLEAVERILGEIHDARPKGFLARLFKREPSDETIQHLSKMFGGYVGEVIRRSCGGRWKEQSDAFPNQTVVTLEIANNGDIWPQFKAGKRILNGEEDNILHYFQVVTAGKRRIKNE